MAEVPCQELIKRAEFVKAGKDALIRDGRNAFADMGSRALAARVVEAVEPLIRANERGDADERIAAVAEERDAALFLLADLRAKVEALGHDESCSIHDAPWSNGACTCLRGVVLDLIDGADQ